MERLRKFLKIMEEYGDEIPIILGALVVAGGFLLVAGMFIHMVILRG